MANPLTAWPLFAFITGHISARIAAKLIGADFETLQTEVFGEVVL